MSEPTTAGKRIQTTGLVLLVAGACCPTGWHGFGAGLLGLLLLAGKSLWAQVRTRGFVAMPWVLAALLAWWGLSISVVPPGRLGALREWLQWGLLLGGGWYASRALGRDGWERFPTIASVGLGVSLAVGVLQLLWPGATIGLVSLLHGAPYAAGGNGPELAEEVVVGLQRSHLQYCALVYLALPFALIRLRHVWLRLPLLLVACCTVQPGLLLVPIIGIGMCLVVPWGQQEHRIRDLLLRLSVLLIAYVSIGLRLGVPPSDWSLTGSQERLAIERQAALRTVPARPLGYGPGTYRESVRKARIAADLPKPEQNRVRRDGNSQFLVHTIETGAIGAVLLLTYMLLAFWGARQRNDMAVALLVVLIVGFATVFLVRGLGPLCCVLLGYGWVRRDARGGRHLVAQIALIAVAVGAGLAWPYREEVVAAVPVADLPHTQERIWVEAEAAKTISPKWRIDPEVAVGGNEVLRVPLGVGKRVGNASYRLVSPAAGRWKLWLRVRWSGGCANSILASVDGSPPVSVEDAIFGRWHWVDVHPTHTFVLPEGEFRLVLSNSEDDVAVDQIVFLPDPKDMPVGILEAANSTEAKPEPAAAPAQGWDFDEEAAPSDGSFNKYDD